MFCFLLDLLLLLFVIFFIFNVQTLQNILICYETFLICYEIFVHGKNNNLYLFLKGKKINNKIIIIIINVKRNETFT